MAHTLNSDKDHELTMCDVLQEEQELEEDANAVLGGSDDTNCSYDQGYIPRQALYACTTCSVSGEAGVCLACCYACHEGHEVVELYTKRNFRCDCGNSKFNGKSCMLRPQKEHVNERNKYNHNFKGLYCSCSRPYPDLEDNIPDEMIQCVLCEDWYHGRHLGCKVPEDYFEMICRTCMESHKFLYSYLNAYNIKVDVENKDTKPVVEAEASSSSPSKKEAVDGCNGVSSNVTPVKKETSDESTTAASSSQESDSPKLECKVPSNGSTSDKPNLLTTGLKNENSTAENGAKVCSLKSINADVDITSGSAFWPERWRSELCRCSNCMNMYVETGCDFLLKPEDTIQAYEERGKGGSAESQYDKGLSALSQLDRVKQMEAVRAYTSMKGQLKEYLKEFADNKRTVCESDIKEFFERMAKKQKLQNGVPHFCR